MTHRHHGTRSSAYYAHPSHGDPKIKVLIRIDAVEESARVDVRGVVTPANIRALYVVCRRVAAKLPGYEIVVNLTHARVTADAIEELHEHARHSVMSSGIDASVTPCRLRIVDPPSVLRVNENA